MNVHKRCELCLVDFVLLVCLSACLSVCWSVCAMAHCNIKSSSYDIMMRCWFINADDRLDFSKIVEELETFLAELVNYFDPSNPEPPEDPYMHWKLAKEIVEGEDEDADPGAQLSTSGNTLTSVQINDRGSSNSLDKLVQSKSSSPLAVGDDQKSTAALKSASVLKGGTL